MKVPVAELCPGTGTCTLLLFGDTKVTANFEPAPLKKLSLEVSGSGSGSVSSEPGAIDCASGTCSEEFAEGLPVVLTAHPSPHNEVAKWSGCDSEPSPDVCDVTMSAAKAVNVEFTPIPQLPLGLTLEGTGQGTVVSYPPGISCPGTCSASFDRGSTVYLMAAPSPGSGFGGFSGGGCEGTAPLCAIPISSAQEIRALFTGTANGPSTTNFFSLTSARTSPSGALLTLKAAQPGTLLVSSAGLKPLKRKLSAGTSHVRVSLSARFRHTLSRHPRLSLRVALGFLPSGGSPPQSSEKTLRFSPRRH